MTQIVKSLFITLTVLFVWRVCLEEGAEACTCLKISTQQSICHSNVVLRAYIIGSEQVDIGNVRSTKYTIYPYQVFRGPIIYAIYTSGPCRGFLDNAIGQDYLLTGQLDSEGSAHFIMCNFKKPWNYLTGNERRLIHNLYHNCG